MAKKRKHTWFLWPKNNHTNEVFARFLESGAYGLESETLKDVICEDEQRRNLWKCTHLGAWCLWRSRADLKFEVFCQEGSNGKIRNVTFLFKGDRRRPKKAKVRKRVFSK